MQYTYPTYFQIWKLDFATGIPKASFGIGASITIGSQFLPNYVKSFYEVCPEIDVRVTIEQSERLEQKILANELDCALIEVYRIILTSYLKPICKTI